MTNEGNRPARLWYEYRGQKEMIPPEFIYKIAMGSGYDISEAFFTYAFKKHGISIVDIQILYASDNRDKPVKDTTSASSAFIIASVKGRDKHGQEFCGDGEAGSENITNYQRKFPAGIAIKRAKVSMGKEFLSLTDLRFATDCRDFKVTFGEYEGQTIEDIAKKVEGVKTLRWISSKFQGDEVLKSKVNEFLSNYLVENSQPVIEVPTEEPLTAEQKKRISDFRAEKGVANLALSTIAREICGASFTWEKATKSQGDKILEHLKTR